MIKQAKIPWTYVDGVTQAWISREQYIIQTENGLEIMYKCPSNLSEHLSNHQEHLSNHPSNALENTQNTLQQGPWAPRVHKEGERVQKM